MARVEFIEVSKQYGDIDVVHDVTLAVEDHEFLVLLGPSGCGKSTLLKMVAGLEDISGGEIYIDDRLVNYVKPADRNVAMVFQNYALYPHMTVRENIGFPLKMTGVSKQETDARVQRAAETLGMEGLLDRRPEQLSGGQRQRVALGRAIVREPSVFLMDEPLSNLDAQLRVQTREELLKLHARLQTTTIYVTHDQIEAMTMGHRIVVMRSGRIQQVGKPQDVYDNPVNTFVAAFLGSPRISLHTGHISSVDGKPAFVREETVIPLTGRPGRLANSVTAGEDVALGVRPENIRVVANGQTTAGAHEVFLPAVVSFIEPVGSDLFVNAVAGGLAWMARADARLPVTPGQSVGLMLDLQFGHLFGSDGSNLASRV